MNETERIEKEANDLAKAFGTQEAVKVVRSMIIECLEEMKNAKDLKEIKKLGDDMNHWQFVEAEIKLR